MIYLLGGKKSIFNPSSGSYWSLSIQIHHHHWGALTLHRTLHTVTFITFQNCLRLDVWGLMSETWCLRLDVWGLMSEAWCLRLDVWCLMSETWCLRLDVWIFNLSTLWLHICGFKVSEIYGNSCRVPVLTGIALPYTYIYSPLFPASVFYQVTKNGMSSNSIPLLLMWRGKRVERRKKEE